MAVAASLNGVLGTILLMRTLVVACVLPPILISLMPLLVGLSFAILNKITLGYGTATVAGTVAMTIGGRAIISSHAPSIQHRDDALRKSSVALPALCFALFLFILHVALLPLCLAVGIKHQHLTMTPSLPYAYTLQLAASAFFLGLSVVIRYFGFASIIRCSAFPLICRPITAAIQSLLARCHSGDAFLSLIAAPSDTPGVLIDSPFQSRQDEKGRRYKGPYVQAVVMLFLISFLLAVMAAGIVSYRTNTTEGSTMIVTACSMSVLLHIMFTCLDGKSHELNPKNFRNLQRMPFVSHPTVSQYLKSCIISAVVVPATLLISSTTNAWELSVLANSIVVAVIVNVYLSAIDIISQSNLCACKSSLRKLMSEVTVDITPELTTEVILRSLLLYNNDLLESIMEPTPKHGTNQLEEEELSRNKKDSDNMALVLTRKLPDTTGLGDDLLRLTILESFGGKDPGSTLCLQASEQHDRNVKDLMIGISRLQGRIEPLAGPLVRALCAYTSGLGVALKQLCKPPNPKQPRLLTPAGFESWALPPGALMCSERAITGVTRFVVSALTSTEHEIDWRSSHLSSFVPVVLVAAFQLRSGLESYEKQMGWSMSQTNTPSAIDHLHEVQQTCDDCALHLFKVIRSRETRAIEVTITMKECRAWIDNLLSKSDFGNPRFPPILVLENDRPIAKFNTGGFALKYY